MNRYNPHIHHRKSIHLKGYDCAQAGLYFITNTLSAMKNRIDAFRNTLSTILQNGRMIIFINNEQRHSGVNAIVENFILNS